LADGELSPEAVLSYQLLSDALDAFLASY